MTDSFYAHSHPDKSWQPLEEHLRQCAELAAGFAQFFGGEAAARWLGLCHDLGKYQDAFQCGVLRQQQRGVDHSSAGALYLRSRFPKGMGGVLAAAISGHHGGLKDSEQLTRRWAKAIGLDEQRMELARERLQLEQLVPPKMPFWTWGEQAQDWHKKNGLCFLLRFLFSALVDADFLDTERFYSPAISAHRQQSPPSMHQLSETLQHYLRDLPQQGELNGYRRQLQQRCLQTASSPPGLYSLCAATGSGKTLATLLFALEHAAQHQLQRVIIAIPFTSIIEQTAQLLRHIFGPQVVLEHHSHVVLQEESEDERDSNADPQLSRSRLATENWDAPLVVTTNVQLFESLYAARVSRCRKLHNIAASCIIVDEPQGLPLEQLLPISSAVDILQRGFRVSWLFCSATQPTFQHLPEQLPALCPTEIPLPSPPPVLNRRVCWHWQPQKHSWQQIAEKLKTHPQVLCIVNSRPDTLALWQQLDQDAHLLSSYLCPAHRRQLLQELKDRLRDGKPVRVISTQVVEAGVDIDFPVVFRALAGLDSLVQAAGRCNREGRLASGGRIVVFRPPQPPAVGSILRRGYQISEQLLPHQGYDENLIPLYFQELYRDHNQWDCSGLEKYLASEEGVNFRYRSFANHFRLIEDQQKRFFVHFQESSTLLEQLEQQGPSRPLLRQLQHYQVGIFAHTFDEWVDQGLLRQLPESDVWMESQPGLLYHTDHGLQPEANFLDPEHLII